MKQLKSILFTFVCVTTCVVFATACFTTIFWPKAVLGSEILWQILLVSFFCSMGIFIYPPERELTRRETLVRVFLHYLEVNVVVLGCGLWFEWFYIDNPPMVIGMVVMILLIFVLVSYVVWKNAEKTAALMNEKLREYQNPAGLEEVEKSKSKNS